MHKNTIAFVACAAILSSCAGSGSGSGPRGWTQTNGAGSWVNPKAPKQTFSVLSAPFDGTLKDLASQITTNIILTNQAMRAKFVDGLPFTRCPGEAIFQTYSMAAVKSIIEVAFAVQDGKKVVAEYRRPATDKDDPAAVDAMAANVCSAT